ncbi:hypothetical protein [Gordonia sihwensis]|uniref:hypothetical protein n=1 Tax=Gordonia sihwensis TaxID=173559 RepID=UPI003D958115
MSDTQRRDYRRRMVYHQRIVDRLPLLDWDVAHGNLARTRRAVQGELAVAAVNEWGSLLALRDTETIARILTENSDHADLMRVVSPFAGMLTDEERRQVITETSRRGPIN